MFDDDRTRATDPLWGGVCSEVSLLQLFEDLAFAIKQLPLTVLIHSSGDNYDSRGGVTRLNKGRIRASPRESLTETEFAEMPNSLPISSGLSPSTNRRKQIQRVMSSRASSASRIRI